MQKKSKKLWIIAVPLILILGYFIYDAYSQPSIEDIPGDFTEVAFVRNENNKGGIIRIYAVTVGDQLNAQYDKCADMFPVNDYGSITKVYFFDKNKPFPTSLNLEEPHYDTAKYEAINILSRRGLKK
ncbi:hypothetical protein ACFQ2C_05135 [Sphingobacterium daejeonense]|jgi:hypothetical protein|uniref:Uncharacterized protein n=1 Tax=Sphingobacterium daejeonense TaxID=371142 RepID=A0ABW3RIG3_9SPHI|nr:MULTISPECIES: hypothetical protein [Sphingobacterium]VTP99286.1 Uncharacterised protein [Sphingobacterium daejeonense]